MGAPRLILVEGMIGSGKTTTAGYLADWLSRRGEDVRAFDEGAADHPIRTRRVDELLAAPEPGDPGVYSAGQWRRLAERCLRVAHAFERLSGGFPAPPAAPARPGAPAPPGAPARPGAA